MKGLGQVPWTRWGQARDICWVGSGERGCLLPAASPAPHLEPSLHLEIFPGAPRGPKARSHWGDLCWGTGVGKQSRQADSASREGGVEGWGSRVSGSQPAGLGKGSPSLTFPPTLNIASLARDSHQAAD